MLKGCDRQKLCRQLTALGYVLLLGLVAGYFFDFYYDLNDDVLMKDIMAGAYTGRPEGYNIQMLYPISACISWFYRILPGVSWYGIFLSGSQLLCFYLISIRILGESRVISHGSRDKKAWMRRQTVTWLLLCGLQFILVYSMLLEELVYIQYTVTCALMSGTAAFWFYTTPKGSAKGFLKQNIVSILLVTVAFQVRSEMLLLTLPLIGVTGLCKWWNSFEGEKIQGTAWYLQFFSKENLLKYGGTLAAVSIGLLLSLGINRIAYGSEQWQTFLRFFDARTQIYDFYGIPDYEAHQEFYSSIGVSREQWRLLENYNFGLDQSIDDDTLENIAEYAKNNYQAENPSRQLLRNALWNYRKHLSTIEDAPWNICVGAAYLLLAVLGIINRKKCWLWQLPLLFATRSALWMYILYRNRAPERITHSLYLAEFLVLAAFLWEACREPYGKKIRLSVGVVLAACAVSFLPSSWKQTADELTRREAVNQDYLALQEYCRSNGDNYYLLDVMSTTAFSEKMFKQVDNSIKNYDIIGGWASKSPVNRTALESFGISDIEENLLVNTNLYVISEQKNMDGWLEYYYLSRNKKIQVLEIKEIEHTVYKDLAVYQVRRLGGGGGEIATVE